MFLSWESANRWVRYNYMSINSLLFWHIIRPSYINNPFTPWFLTLKQNQAL
jgi:hypothetical protein